ncbi:ArsR/SmtB family transcription factor [Fictibacillus fluitans]|uniref:Metalloregulator ArsR/SmtB family transcription factor n=1 Tax=Fictibacillus fluitans TaxID=3058422 RepID=A0ABT8HYP1_9BACL|nr:metalloregulator ArsR/SmtB family transcription factor [Fictibacillus sp. NE201]MDN4525863.1 metalloregulator ArsR/SmtB family transcription factor [Fictibacillus sp. NE201]
MNYFLASQPEETVNVTVESSEVWEILLGISGYTYAQLRHTFELDEQWKTWRNTMSPELLEALHEIQETNLWYGLLLLQNHWGAATVQDFLNGLDQESHQSLYEVLLPYYGQKSEADRKDTVINHTDKTRFARYAEFFKGHDYLEGYVRLLGERALEDILSLMKAVTKEWHNFIRSQPVWEKWVQALMYEEKENQGLNQSHAMEEIKRITGGAEYVPEPSVWNVKLVPHVSYRPWVLSLRTVDTKLLFYPVKEEYLNERGQPSSSLIRGHKALGDELRLQLLHTLVQGQSSLQELSGKFHMSKTTLHHQLSILKSAGLVSADKGVYRANTETLRRFSGKLDEYLGLKG